MGRFLLIAVLINGLAPALGEVAETVVHKIIAGHFAHDGVEDRDLGELGSEHGCGTTAHMCRCCSSQPMTSQGKMLLTAVRVHAASVFKLLESPISSDHRALPFRPPIG